jgi:hypothetical protein
MSVKNGDVVILQFGGVQLGAIITNSQNMSADMLDKSNKDTPGIKQYDSGESGWGLSVEALFDPAAGEGFSEALGYLKAGTQLTVLHGDPSTGYWTGSAMIASIDLSGPKNEISSYSLEIQGTGELGTFCSEYQAVYDSFTSKPSAAIASAQDTMVRALVDGGVWDRLDVFYMFANENSGADNLINWVNPGTNNATAVSSPTWTSLEGYTGDGSADYIDTNYNPSTDAVNLSLNSYAYGVYIRNNVEENAGVIGNSTARNYLYPRRVGDSQLCRINSSSNLAGSVADSRGLWIATRTASNARALYRNGASVDSDTDTPVSVDNANAFVLAISNAGTPADLSNYQVAVAFYGSGLGLSHVTALTNAVEVYMDSNSKGVIT